MSTRHNNYPSKRVHCCSVTFTAKYVCGELSVLTTLHDPSAFVRLRWRRSASPWRPASVHTIGQARRGPFVGCVKSGEGAKLYIAGIRSHWSSGRPLLVRHAPTSRSVGGIAETRAFCGSNTNRPITFALSAPVPAALLHERASRRRPKLHNLHIGAQKEFHQWVWQRDRVSTVTHLVQPKTLTAGGTLRGSCRTWGQKPCAAYLDSITGRARESP